VPVRHVKEVDSLNSAESSGSEILRGMVPEVTKENGMRKEQSTVGRPFGVPPQLPGGIHVNAQHGYSEGTMQLDPERVVGMLASR
jgi:hypothetical protein